MFGGSEEEEGAKGAFSDVEGARANGGQICELDFLKRAFARNLLKNNGKNLLANFYVRVRIILKNEITCTGIRRTFVRQYVYP